MPKIFGFADAYTVRGGILVWNVICAVIVVAAGHSDGMKGLLLTLAVCGPGPWALQLYAFVKTMDVVIDDDGLSRLYRGRRWLSIRWTDIGSLVSRTRVLVPYNGGKPRNVTYLHVGLVSKLPVGLLRLREFVFSSQMAGFDEFVDIVKQKVSGRNVEVEKV